MIKPLNNFNHSTLLTSIKTPQSRKLIQQMWQISSITLGVITFTFAAQLLSTSIGIFSLPLSICIEYLAALAVKQNWMTYQVKALEDRIEEKLERIRQEQEQNMAQTD